MRDIRYPQLEKLSPGETGVVVRVSDRSPALLRRLAKLGVLPGVVLKVLARRHGDCQVELNGRKLSLPSDLCEGVYIQWLDAAAKS